MGLLDEFKANSREFNSTAEHFAKYKAEQRGHVEKTLEEQSDIRKERIEKGETVSAYEKIWQDAKPGDKIPGTGRGKHSRAVHVAKLDNKSPSRNKSHESKRCKERGLQYLSMKTNKVMKAKKVM